MNTFFSNKNKDLDGTLENSNDDTDDELYTETGIESNDDCVSDFVDLSECGESHTYAHLTPKGLILIPVYQQFTNIYLQKN